MKKILSLILFCFFLVISDGFGQVSYSLKAEMGRLRFNTNTIKSGVILLVPRQFPHFLNPDFALDSVVRDQNVKKSSI